MEVMMEGGGGTLQNRCVLRGCAGVDVVQYAFHPARGFCVLRPSVPKCPPAQSDLSPLTGFLQLFFGFSVFWIFLSSKSSKTLR